MSRTYEYRSGLASQISAFIAEKRACGCKYEKEAKTFQTLDRFLVEQGINTPVLPELVVEKWIEKRPNEKRKNQKWRLNFTKRFAKYLQLNGYAAYYPELTISSRDDADFSPCIFTSDELARIMNKLCNFMVLFMALSGNVYAQKTEPWFQAGNALLRTLSFLCCLRL